MGENHLIKTVTHSWLVSTKIKKQSKQVLNKLPREKEGWQFDNLFLAKPHKLDTGLPALIVATALNVTDKSDAM